MVRPRPRWIRPLLVASTALLALELAHAITDLGPLLGPFAANWLFSFLPLAAAAACAARAVTVPAERAIWAALAVAMVAWSGADAYYVWAILRDASPPYPSWTDAGWLPFYPACLVAVIALLRAERRRPPAPVVLDAAVAALAAGTALAALVAPWLAGNVTGGTAAVLVTLAYPVFDILLLAAAMIAFALTGWRPGTRWCLIAAGLILRVVEDTGWLHMVTHGGYVHGGLMDALCPASMLLIGWAAWTPAATPARAVPAYGPHALIVPAAGVLTALGILVADHVVDLPLPALLLAGATCLAVVARMGLTYRELRGLANSREEALTDDLTGLANRRRLVRDLDAALAARAPHTFALFDLDGFKRFNDLLGHSAGDDLLARLAERLHAATGDGTAYRLGGDEFCLLVPGDRQDVVSRAVGALTHEGDVAVRPSAGVVRLPQEADDATYALQLADERMYLVKESGRAPFERQVRDVLLGVLAEQQPDLHAHAGGVAEHVRAIGRRLGLDHRELQQLVWAAELHDVGKVALPRQMLEKRGPLDEAEWRLMRTHTLIGERVLGSAPALRAAARLVRSSHERWDGRGYPDGLAGEAIPLGARIIAACDAYDAMRSERPYQRARSHAAAMTELRRCAGTQFDSTVVTALEAELSPGFVADVATTASGEAAPPSPPLRPVRGRPAP